MRSRTADLRRSLALLLHGIAILVLLTTALVAVGLLAVGADQVTPAGEPGSEMAPELRSHHLVFLEHVDPGELERGDVVAVDRNGERQYRRIARVTENPQGDPQFITRADARAEFDRDHVRAEQILGRVTFSAPLAGRPVAAAYASPIGRFHLAGIAGVELLGGMAIAASLVVEGRRLAKYFRRRSSEQPASDAGRGIALTRADLNATFASLGVLVAYSLSVVVTILTPLTVAITIGVLGSFAFVGFLWWNAPGRPDDVSTAADVTVLDVDVSDVSDGRPRILIDSTRTLEAMAAAAGKPLLVDADDALRVLPTDDALYVSEESS